MANCSFGKYIPNFCLEIPWNTHLFFQPWACPWAFPTGFWRAPGGQHGRRQGRSQSIRGMPTPPVAAVAPKKKPGDVGFHSQVPSGEHTKSYWKWPFIVDFPIKHGDFPWQNVSSPEGTSIAGWFMIWKLLLKLGNAGNTHVFAGTKCIFDGWNIWENLATPW